MGPSILAGLVLLEAPTPLVSVTNRLVVPAGHEGSGSARGTGTRRWRSRFVIATGSDALSYRLSMPSNRRLFLPAGCGRLSRSGWPHSRRSDDLANELSVTPSYDVGWLTRGAGSLGG